MPSRRVTQIIEDHADELVEIAESDIDATYTFPDHDLELTYSELAEQLLEVADTPETDETTETVQVRPEGEKYHRLDCHRCPERTADRSRELLRAEAEELGYAPAQCMTTAIARRENRPSARGRSFPEVFDEYYWRTADVPDDDATWVRVPAHGQKYHTLDCGKGGASSAIVREAVANDHGYDRARCWVPTLDSDARTREELDPADILPDAEPVAIPEGLPDHLNPFAIIETHGFEARAAAARRLLPDDWGAELTRTPRGIAAGLVYYIGRVMRVGYDRDLQASVADVFDCSPVAVRQNWADIRDLLGPPRQYR